MNTVFKFQTVILNILTCFSEWMIMKNENLMYRLQILISFFWFRNAYAAAEDDDVEADSSDEDLVHGMIYIFETSDDDATVAYT